MNIITSLPDPIQPKLPDADISYFPSFINDRDATSLFDQLLAETDWKEESITLFGKNYKYTQCDCHSEAHQARSVLGQ